MRVSARTDRLNKQTNPQTNKQTIHLPNLDPKFDPCISWWLQICADFEKLWQNLQIEIRVHRSQITLIPPTALYTFPGAQIVYIFLHSNLGLP